jgi:hypothetical protein
LAAQGHLPNDFLLAGDLSFAFGDVSISFREVLALHVCHRHSSSASGPPLARPSAQVTAS